MRKPKTKQNKTRRGPKPEILALEGRWVDAVKAALTKPPVPKALLIKTKKRRSK